MHLIYENELSGYLWMIAGLNAYMQNILKIAYRPKFTGSEGLSPTSNDSLVLI